MRELAEEVRRQVAGHYVALAMPEWDLDEQVGRAALPVVGDRLVDDRADGVGVVADDERILLGPAEPHEVQVVTPGELSLIGIGEVELRWQIGTVVPIWRNLGCYVVSEQPQRRSLPRVSCQPCAPAPQPAAARRR